MTAASFLLPMMLPWAMVAPADQIWMGAQLPPIQSERLTLSDGRIMIAVEPRHWIQVKRRAEAQSGYCQTAVEAASDSAAAQCKLTLDSALERERLTLATDQATIKALRAELLIRDAELLEVRDDLKVVEWVAIVGGVATLGLSVGLALK